MKFKIGDKVKVLPNLLELARQMKEKNEISVLVTLHMIDTECFVTTIKDVYIAERLNNYTAYKCSCGDNCWYNEWMLKPVIQKLMEIE